MVKKKSSEIVLGDCDWGDGCALFIYIYIYIYIIHTYIIYICDLEHIFYREPYILGS